MLNRKIEIKTHIPPIAGSRSVAANHAGLSSPRLGFKSRREHSFILGPVDQPGRSPPWHGGGRGFKSRPVHSFHSCTVLSRKIFFAPPARSIFSLRSKMSRATTLFFKKSLAVLLSSNIPPSQLPRLRSLVDTGLLRKFRRNFPRPTRSTFFAPFFR